MGSIFFRLPLMSLALLLLVSCSEKEEFMGSSSYSNSRTPSTGSSTSSSNSTDIPTSLEGFSLSEEEVSSLNLVSTEVAQQVVFSKAKTSLSQVQGYEVVLHDNSGIWEYQVNFWVDTIQYFYTLSGIDGSVLSFSTVFHDSGYVAPEVEETEEPEEQEEFVATEGNLTLDEVKVIATQHAGISIGEIYNIQIVQGYNGSIPQYKLNFTTETHNFEYYIAANTGLIFSSTKEAVEREDDFFTLPEVEDVEIPDISEVPEEEESPSTTEPSLPVVPEESLPSEPETSVPELNAPVPELTAPPVYGDGS